MSKRNNIFIDSAHIEVSLGYFFSNFRLRDFTDYFKKSLKTLSIPYMNIQGFNMFMTCNPELILHITE